MKGNDITDVDLMVENHGSIYLVRPMTERGIDWLKRTAPADAQFMGSAMAVEHRYIEGVIATANDDGLVVG